ncbi:MAG: pantetheine-phosphate adenylyltransferase [Aggregatilineales bacterium]
MTRTVVYPGSFDPIHNGHIDIASRASNIFDEVIVAVYDMPKKKLLFNVDERVQMAETALQDYGNIKVARFSGLVVNYVQSVGAIAILRGLRVFSDFEFEFRYGIANRKLAPEIETVAIMSDENHLHISSSTIREIAELGGSVKSMVPAFIADALEDRFTELHNNQSSPGYNISIRD